MRFIEKIPKGDVTEDPKKLFRTIEGRHLGGRKFYDAWHIEFNFSVPFKDCIRGIESSVVVLRGQRQFEWARCDLPFQASSSYLSWTSAEIHKQYYGVEPFGKVFVGAEGTQNSLIFHPQISLPDNENGKFDVYSGFSRPLCSVGRYSSRASEVNCEDSEYGGEDCYYQRTKSGDNRVLIRDISSDAMSVGWDRSDENGDAFLKMLGAWIILSIAFYALLKI